MQSYSKTIRVKSDDLDELNHVNNVRYVQWINDIAKEHWLQNASQDMLDNYIWVVLQHQINYKSAAFLNDELTIKTYVSLSKGVTSSRVVEITHNTTNKLVVKSETNFCLLDSKSNRPIRIPPDIINLFN